MPVDQYLWAALMIVQNRGTLDRWGFCDACGERFQQGATTPGYVMLTRKLVRAGWQVQPYLELYCPAHRV